MLRWEVFKNKLATSNISLETELKGLSSLSGFDCSARAWSVSFEGQLTGLILHNNLSLWRIQLTELLEIKTGKRLRHALSIPLLINNTPRRNPRRS